MSGEAGKLKMFSYCPTRHERTVDWPKDLDICVCVSGAKAEKTAGAMQDYNNAAFLAFDAARAYCDADPKGRELRRSGDTFVANRPNLAEICANLRSKGATFEDCRLAVEATLRNVDDGATVRPNGAKDGRCYEKGALVRRFDQFFAESERILPNLAEALQNDQRKRIGELLDESHRRTVSELRNTIPETAW